MFNAGLVKSFKTAIQVEVKPYILVFCSVGIKNNKVLQSIRDYLSEEWKVTTNTECNFTEEEMPVKYPRVPRQPNGTDCGLYLLHFVEMFFQRLVYILSLVSYFILDPTN